MRSPFRTFSRKRVHILGFGVAAMTQLVGRYVGSRCEKTGRGRGRAPRESRIPERLARSALDTLADSLFAKRRRRPSRQQRAEHVRRHVDLFTFMLHGLLRLRLAPPSKVKVRRPLKHSWVQELPFPTALRLACWLREARRDGEVARLAVRPRPTARTQLLPASRRFITLRREATV